MQEKIIATRLALTEMSSETKIASEQAKNKFSSLCEKVNDLINQIETENQSPFMPGDVVRLKSGGEKMTVSDVSKFATTGAYWFNKDGNMQGAVIPNGALVKIGG